MALGLPFAHLNLRWNPFGDLPRAEAAALAVLSPPPLSPGEILQIMGLPGRGKTTTLLALLAQHPGAGYEEIEEGEERLKTPLSSLPEPFLLDEAQRLAPPRLRALFARAKTLVLGSAQDLSRLSPRPVRTITVGGLTPARLGEILARRVEWARRGPGPVPRFPPGAAEELIARFGDDLRAIEDHLYFRFQELQEAGDVTV